MGAAQTGNHCLMRVLSAEESALYDEQRDNRISRILRQEQERIGGGWMEAALARLDEE